MPASIRGQRGHRDPLAAWRAAAPADERIKAAPLDDLFQPLHLAGVIPLMWAA